MSRWQVNIQAYLLWEQAGRPDGADFAGDARATLKAQLRTGKSIQDLESALKVPEPKVFAPSSLSMHDSLACSLQLRAHCTYFRAECAYSQL